MAEQIEGLAELQKRLADMGAVAGGKALRSSVMQASLPAYQAIRASAPTGSKAHRTFKGRLVAPGFLSRNIRRKSTLTSDKTHAQVIIGPAQEAFYAKFLEFGTKFMAPRTFMEPAFKAAVPAMIERLKQKLGEKIDKAAAGHGQDQS